MPPLRRSIRSRRARGDPDPAADRPKSAPADQRDGAPPMRPPGSIDAEEGGDGRPRGSRRRPPCPPRQDRASTGIRHPRPDAFGPQIPRPSPRARTHRAPSTDSPQHGRTPEPSPRSADAALPISSWVEPIDPPRNIPGAHRDSMELSFGNLPALISHPIQNTTAISEFRVPLKILVRLADRLAQHLTPITLRNTL